MADHRQHEPIAGAVLAWYERNRRDLPWRARPGKLPDPYRVWLSEVMLQQTTVAVAGRYFVAFLARWPTLERLAAASLDEVLAAWAGLGYYARARNLHACARIIVAEHRGRFPQSVAELGKLPGIGRYTAAAIAAIAFDVPAAAVDGNVERVMARLEGIATPLPDAKALIAQATARLVPSERPGDFAQALMDLGALVCTPRRPDCRACPLVGTCVGYRSGSPERLPVKRRRGDKPTRFGACFFAERGDGAVLLRRREERGLLGGMLEFPSSEWGPAPPDDPLAAAPLAAPWRAVPGQVEHSFTHFDLVLTVHSARVGTAIMGADPAWRWIALEALDRAALPSVMRKVAAHVLGLRRRRATTRRGAPGARGRSG
jgi:A/G-specific adenine glycosylase